MSASFEHSEYLISTKLFTAFARKFYIYDPRGSVAFFARMKPFKLLEDIRLYTGEDMQGEALCLKCRKVFELTSHTFDVYDSTANNVKVGAIQRKNITSMLRDEWLILDENDREIGTVVEDSLILAIVRRLLTNLIPQSYSGTIRGREVCTFTQNFNPFLLKIKLDFKKDYRKTLDRRLGIAAAVLLCAVEKRQN